MDKIKEQKYKMISDSIIIFIMVFLAMVIIAYIYHRVV